MYPNHHKNYLTKTTFVLVVFSFSFCKAQLDEKMYKRIMDVTNCSLSDEAQFYTNQIDSNFIDIDRHYEITGDKKSGYDTIVKEIENGFFIKEYIRGNDRKNYDYLYKIEYNSNGKFVRYYGWRKEGIYSDFHYDSVAYNSNGIVSSRFSYSEWYKKKKLITKDTSENYKLIEEKVGLALYKNYRNGKIEYIYFHNKLPVSNGLDSLTCWKDSSNSYKVKIFQNKNNYKYELKYYLHFNEKKQLISCIDYDLYSNGRTSETKFFYDEYGRKIIKTLPYYPKNAEYYLYNTTTTMIPIEMKNTEGNNVLYRWRYKKP